MNKLQTWIGNNKLSSFLIVCLFAFIVSTWTLAAINADLNRRLDEKNHQSDTTSAVTDPITTPSTNEVNSTTTTTTTTTTGPVNLRLRDDVKPILYDLLLHPDLQTGHFTGNVKIDLAISSSIYEFAIHTHLMNISSVKFTLPGSNVEVESYEHHAKLEQLKIYLTNSVGPTNNSTLEIDFSGSLNDKIVGFYRSAYKDNEGNARYIATSKFEPTFARQSFPCFDEPSMKAKYKIALISPDGDGYHALSNMDVEKIEDYDTGLKKYIFKESVPMSTYLTVFIVSDFARKNVTANVGSEVGEPFELSVYSTPGQLSKTDYALNVSQKIIEFYIDYFKIPYPLPKLDLAAIPDFVSGAMETWGLITYRETNLLYDVATSSTANKQRICSVIAHEGAHMWFGNLVTMKWWNDLWLNEGFASYIEFKGENAAEPDWNMMDQFTTDTMHSVLDLDATLGSHPIVVGVETPDQITEIFDSITYNKGASIIRMIEDFVGPDNFQNGVSDYLTEMKYLNADSDDLLRNLKKYTDLDISSIVNTFIRQKGIPVVTVEKIGTTVQLTQKRFLTDPDSESKETVASEFNYKWSIPITYFSDADNTTKREWFYHNMDKLTLDIGNANWVKINKDQVGYYRVNYNQSMWESMKEALKANINAMSVLDRAHLLNDVFSLAQGLKIDYTTALKMTEFLEVETSFIPWDVASTKLKNIRNLLYGTEFYKEFMKYVTTLVDGAYNNVNWEVNPANHLENLNRISILDLACSFEHKTCLEEVGTRFEKWLKEDPVNIRPHPDLRSLIYYYGMKSKGTESYWNLMFDIFKNEQDASEKAKLQSGLAAIQDQVILTQYIDIASANETYVRKQDYFSLLSSISGNRMGEPLVWDFVRTNWPNLVERFGLNERNLGRMIPTITSKFAKPIRLQEMKDFFRTYPEAGAGANARTQALETIENNIKWLANNKNSVGDFLQSLNV